jgi:hypothetical protein
VSGQLVPLLNPAAEPLSRRRPWINANSGVVGGLSPAQKGLGSCLAPFLTWWRRGPKKLAVLVQWNLLRGRDEKRGEIRNMKANEENYADVGGFSRGNYMPAEYF